MKEENEIKVKEEDAKPDIKPIQVSGRSFAPDVND